MSEFIKEMMPANVASDINKAIEQADLLFKPFFSNLTEDNKKGLRTMAEGREGYARLISKIAIANPDSLSKVDDPAVLAARIDYDAMLETTRQLIMKFSEKIAETQSANSVDTMKLVDKYNTLLQLSRNHTEGVDNAMREVDDWNKRFGLRNEKPGEETAPTA